MDVSPHGAGANDVDQPLVLGMCQIENSDGIIHASIRIQKHFHGNLPSYSIETGPLEVEPSR